MNPLIQELSKLLNQYGGQLPPLNERRQLWKAIAGTSNEDTLKVFKEYVDTNSGKIHSTLLAEIGKILYD